jgi:hypothetical protein
VILDTRLVRKLKYATFEVSMGFQLRPRVFLDVSLGLFSDVSEEPNVFFFNNKEVQ